MTLYTLPKNYSPDFQNSRKKPLGDVEIDRLDPLGKGLVFYANQTISKELRNIAGSSAVPTIAGTPDPKKSINGATVLYGVGDAVQVDMEPFDTSEMTWMWNSSLEGADSGGCGCMSLADGTADNRYLLYFTFSSWQFFTSNAGAVINFNTAASPAPLSTTTHRHILTIKSGDSKWYIDGILSGSSTDTFAPETNASKVGLSCWQTVSTENDGTMDTSECAIWNRSLTDAEVRELYKAPYRMLKPKTPPIYFTTVSTGISVTVTLGTINYSSQDATVQLTGVVDVTATLGTISYSSQNTTVQLSGEIDLSATLGAINYTSQNTTVQLSGVVDVTATLGAINYESQNTVVQLSSEILVNATLGQIDYTSQNATILLQGEIIIPVTLGTISYDSKPVIVQVGEGQIIGVVTVGFADNLFTSNFKPDDISTQFKPDSITVTFKT